MGHGWKNVSDTEISRKPCSCGKGFIVVYEIEQECDYPPFERTSTHTKYECPDKCYIRK
ncbi:hypothetical protein EDC18_10565 [Natranaerovirga pectinivora]|uniref:Uncharacterized protein n=1 Tax=Natranaerovirga pectinivora TaxID=682400 RepID=A0A4R3MP39_9FIRM|nr:hypothetical protein [Natranaerovirga pectinivora]TCT14584.1 hypothetical protein EDC18_10565 [Natranaerovirga pectinivora]